MTEETYRVVIAGALVLNVALLFAAAIVFVVGRYQRGRVGLARGASPRLIPTFGDSLPGQAGGAAESAPDAALGTTDPVYDRVFRIASWAFLLVAAGIVATSGLWGDALARIVALIAATGALVLLVNDILPSDRWRSARGVVQALAALVFAALLVYLTGGYGSPFFFAFALLVGAAALVVGPFAAFALAVAAAAAYLGAAALASGPPTTIQVVASVVDVTGMFLLTYVASSVGREQHRAREVALRMSALDSLTGLYNRPFFFAAVAREIARSQRSGRGFCLVMLDLDDLKEINDRYGHHAGDAVLRVIADTLRTSIRRADVAARYGGDEFVTLLPETDPTGGWVVAEKIREALRERSIRAFDFSPTVSLGVVSYPADGRSADTLLMSADHAMYVAKRAGKDRVATADRTSRMSVIDGERATARVARAD